VLLGFACAARPIHPKAQPPMAGPGPTKSQLRWTTWVVVNTVGDENPPVRFRFPEPLDSYAGYVRKLQGKLAGDQNLRLFTIKGWFMADIQDVTLGDPDLDQSVRNSAELLNGRQFPVSTFTLDSVEGAADEIVEGASTRVKLRGTLELKGVAVPLEVDASFERRAAENGRPQLILKGSFGLEQLQEKFAITGPGGPDEPAGNRLVLDLHITLVHSDPSEM